jgi:hypothetical protein
VFVNKVSPQNYVFIEPLYDAERMNSLSALNLNRQVDYTFDGKLTPSGAEAWINFLLKHLAWTQADGNFPEMFFPDARNVSAGVIQSCRDRASNLGVNVRPIWF